MRSASCWFCASLSLPAEATLRILPRSGRIACEARSRACLAEPPAESPSTMKISEPCAAVLVQSASLPGSRSLRTALLREISFSWRRRMRSSARSITKSSSLLACTGLPASQWSNGSLIAFSTMRVASAVASRSLVWPWNSGSRMNTDTMQAAPVITSSPVTAAARLPWPMRSAWSLMPLQQRAAQAGLVGAAVRRRDGIAIGREEAVAVGGPGHRPLRPAMDADLAGAAGEDVGMDQRRAVDRGRQISLRPSAKWKVACSGTSSTPRSSSLAQDQRISTPPNR